MRSPQLPLFPEVGRVRRRAHRSVEAIMRFTRERVVAGLIGEEVIIDGMINPRERGGRTISECPSLWRGRKVRITGRTVRDGIEYLTVEGLPALLAPGEYH